MPSLDVNDAFGVEFLDAIIVERRPETVDITGRSRTPGTTTITTSAVVCQAGPNDLARLPESDSMGKVISIVTPFRLRGPAKDGSGQNWKPDVVRWLGGRFVVRLVEPYTGYGRGFVQALAESMTLIDTPPT